VVSEREEVVDRGQTPPACRGGPLLSRVCFRHVRMPLTREPEKKITILAARRGEVEERKGMEWRTGGREEENIHGQQTVRLGGRGGVRLARACSITKSNRYQKTKPPKILKFSARSWPGLALLRPTHTLQQTMKRRSGITVYHVCTRSRYVISLRTAGKEENHPC
jgi:hypothetical protein